MLESTFQLASGIGPARERCLWRTGIAVWSDFRQTNGAVLPGRAGQLLRSAIDAAADALARGDADRLGALLPAGEHWRMLPVFGDGALYLDIETGDDDVRFEGISAIGMLDHQGPRLLLGGRDLEFFPEAAYGATILVTFNGLSFDVPILRRAFPEWRPPVCHVDLRHVLRRLGHGGGLKSIERSLTRLRLARPDHLVGMGGWDASWLWRRGRDGDRAALRLFAEYNLYDVVNLRTLMAYAYNALVDVVDVPTIRALAPRLDVPERGDLLYDVSKILLGL
jgi:uncharacterized protein YprB with RNaseH-like and TPR domain